MKRENKIGFLGTVIITGIGLYLLDFYLSGDNTAKAAETPDNSNPGTIPAGSVNTFLSQYKDLADYTQQFYLIPSLVTLSQAGLESGWGTSLLAKDANNFFGIVADPKWTGPTIKRDSDGVLFRKYSSPKDSFIDHAKFLTTNSNYAPAFDTNDPNSFAQAIANGGYGGTDKTGYYKTLASVMNSLNTILGK